MESLERKMDLGLSPSGQTIGNIMERRSINTTWIYPHAVVNLLGFLILFVPSFFVHWICLIGISFLFLIWDTKRSLKSLNFQPFGLGFANLITLGRLVALLWFAISFQQYTNLTLFIVFTVIIALDGVDGFVARKTGHCSYQGEQLDAETDAQLVWLLSWIHFYMGNVDWWILIPGSLRYTYQLLFFWVPAAPHFPPKRFRATIAVIFFLSLSLGFILPPQLATYLLAMAGGLIVISFAISLFGGLKAKSAKALI